MYGYKGKMFFNIKTGAIVKSVTDGLDLGGDWKNMTDNPEWYPLFNINKEYIGYKAGKGGFVEVVDINDVNTKDC